MNMFGWTTWGCVEFNAEKLRVYKHYTGLVVALPESYPEPFILLSQMNDYINKSD